MYRLFTRSHRTLTCIACCRALFAFSSLIFFRSSTLRSPDWRYPIAPSSWSLLVFSRSRLRAAFPARFRTQCRRYHLWICIAAICCLFISNCFFLFGYGACRLTGILCLMFWYEVSRSKRGVFVLGDMACDVMLFAILLSSLSESRLVSGTETDGVDWSCFCLE